MNNTDYDTKPVNGNNTYVCTDPLCEYCYLMKHMTKEVINIKPILNELPQEYRDTIQKHGGYFAFRASVFIENERIFNWEEIRIYKEQLRYYNRKARSRKARLITNEKAA